jgi:cytochrome c-type biogenesis protein CcmE
MSRIDEELEQAISDADKGRGVASGEHVPSAAHAAADEAGPVVSDAQERKGWGLLAALLVLAGGVLALVFSGGEEAVAYSYKVEEVQAQAADLGERQLRVQGMLVAGSLVRRDSPCEYRFMVRDQGVSTGEALKVRYSLCVVPDTFRDREGVEVTVEGRLSPQGHMEATKIFAKCPSKYDPSTHELNGDPKAGAPAGQYNSPQADNSKGAPARADATSGIR